ncbi:MAG: hypothetical protein Q9183_003935, partial [Haloplaca sp. 2 TL-2023]
WTEYTETHKVWISDSVTKLVATISSTAAAEYERKTGRRVTEKSLGNIIQLHDAEIVATHFGPRASRITLFINRFKAVGSDRSSAIGSPRNFDATQEYLQLIEKLSSFRGATEGPSRSHSVVETPDRTSPAGPRSGRLSFSDDGRYGSQQLFSQIPVSHGRANPVETGNGKSLVGLRLPQGLTDASERNLGQGKVNQNERIIALMKAKHSKKSATESADTSQYPADQQACSPSAALGAVPKPTETGKPVAAQSEQGERPVSPEVPRSTPVRTNPTNIKSHRIRSRDVQISKEQQKLLDQPDSWLPAQPGSRGPVAHVPIAILEEITQSVERGSALTSSDRHLESIQDDADVPEASLSQCDPDGEEQSDLDLPISSADWPASSPLPEPRYDLPPDSSAAGVDDSDKSSINDNEESRGNGNPYPTRFSPQEAPLDGSDHVTSDASLPRMDVDDSRKLAAVTCIDLSDSESDSEANVPASSGQKVYPPEDLTSTQEVPATAIQPEEPFLQVKRTPHGNWGTLLARQNESVDNDDDIVRHSPPAKRRRLDSPTSAQRPIQEARENDSPARSVDREAITGPSQPADHMSNVQSSGIDETVLPPPNQEEPSPRTVHFPTSLHSAEDTPMSDHPSGIEAAATNAPQPSKGGSRRRKVSQQEIGSPILSPFVSKRRKVYRSPYAFGFSQDEFPMEDPAITARKYREEFFASRRNSQSISRTSPNEPEMEKGPRPADAAMQEAAAPEAERQSPDPPVMASANEETQSAAVQLSGHVDSSKSAEEPNMEWQSTYGDGGLGPFRQPETITETGLRQPIVATVERPDLLLTQDLQSDLHSVSTKLEAFSHTETSQQTQRSGQAQTLPELMTPAMSVSDIPHTASPKPNPPAVADEVIEEVDVFTRFKRTYPEYNGTKEHFHGMCKKIVQLLQADRMEHRSLWDDFIIRHKTDYPTYLHRCVDSVEDAKSYERFYRDEIDGPRFTQRIVQPVTLREIVPLTVQGSPQPTMLQRPGSPRTRVGAQRTSSPILPTHDKGSMEVSESVFVQPVPARSRRPSNGSGRVQMTLSPSQGLHTKDKVVGSGAPSPNRTIDLTAEQGSSPKSTSEPRQVKSSTERTERSTRRRLPWKDPESTHPSCTQAERRDSLTSPSMDPQRPPNTSGVNSRRAKGQGEVKRSKIKQKADNGQAVKEVNSPRTLRTASPSDVASGNFQAGTHSKNAAGSLRKKAHFRAPPKAKSNEEHVAVDEWWKDDDTPFRQFSKLYKSITPGQGNSWAQEIREKEKKATSSINRPDVKRRGRADVDVMSWHL